MGLRATSLYVIRSKPLLRRFPALAVTAWSYMVAALFMAVTAVALNSSRKALDFLCADCGGAAHRAFARLLLDYHGAGPSNTKKLLRNTDLQQRKRFVATAVAWIAHSSLSCAAIFK